MRSRRWRRRSRATFASCLAHLEGLERLAATCRWPGGAGIIDRARARRRLRDFHYASALAAWLARSGAAAPRSMVLRGIELDGHGIYRDGHSRADHARAHAALASSGSRACTSRSATSCACALPEQDVLTMLFLFVTAHACLRWGAGDLLRAAAVRARGGDVAAGRLAPGRQPDPGRTPPRTDVAVGVAVRTAGDRTVGERSGAVARTHRRAGRQVVAPPRLRHADHGAADCSPLRPPAFPGAVVPAPFMFTLQILDRGQTFLHPLERGIVLLGNAPPADIVLGEQVSSPPTCASRSAATRCSWSRWPRPASTVGRCSAASSRSAIASRSGAGRGRRIAR